MRILSLGAGVQSSTLALMIAKGEVPMVDAAIFADTQAEPKAVYDWLDWLEKRLPFPVHRVTTGNLMADVISRKDGFNPIPSFHWTGADDPLGIQPIKTELKLAMGRRQCTFQYKLRPLHAKMRELVGLEKGERSKGVAVTCLIGISYDEVHRMKPSEDAWREHEWPLIERRMTRGHCLEWMQNNGYPMPPRSACVFCPYKSDREWKDARDNDALTWGSALAVDNAIRQHGEYLHASGTPLVEQRFWWAAQRDMFGNECEGMCGV